MDLKWGETGCRNRIWQHILSRKGLKFYIFHSVDQYTIYSEFADLLNDYFNLKPVAKAPKK